MAGAFDGAALRLYQDGAPAAATSLSGAIDAAPGSPLNIGTNPRWKGMIDEVRVSNVARSAAWIKASYHTAWDNLLTFGSPEAGG